MTGVTKNSRSGDQKIDGLLTDYRWSASATPLYYGFPGDGEWTGYEGGQEPDVGFRLLSAKQQSVVATIFAEVQSYVAQVTFASAAAGGVAAAEATFRFGHSNLPETAYAYTPWFDEAAGDVWFNNASREYDSPVRGNYAYFTFIHEIGHAIGLKHPHEAETFGTMPVAEDQLSFTVMSYRSYAGAPLDDQGYTTPENNFPQTFMMYDIQALQHLYGANFATRSGDTVYKWSPGTGAVTINGKAGAGSASNKLFMTLWDGGGKDTYDFSAYQSAVTIDLSPGGWSDTGGLQNPLTGTGEAPLGAIANALLYKGDARSLIENAKGGFGADKLSGNAVANLLDGGPGADTMRGFAGNDTYVVDNGSDRVEEQAGGGVDTVRSSVGYTLGTHIERLILTGSAAINGTGNGLANILTGNSAANILKGAAGNDLLDGQGGADTMYGGDGNDTYIVERSTDRAIEQSAGGGFDTVQSSASFALRAYVEKLTLTGEALNGTGNGLANTISGTRAANVLDGRGGADLMRGWGGDDTYIVDHRSDRAIEARADGGLDTVKASVGFTLGAYVENLVLTGSAAIDGSGNSLANAITGNNAVNILHGWSGDDVLKGAGGADKLNGGWGNDILKGGTGADRFVFDKAPGPTNVDSILDFERGLDKILLENKVFAGLAAGALPGGAFAIGSAADSGDRIVYDPATGALFFDPDGSGAAAAVQFALLETKPLLAASDFLVI